MSLWNYKLFMFYVLTSMDVPYKTNFVSFSQFIFGPNFYVFPVSRMLLFSLLSKEQVCCVLFLGTESNADFKKLFLSILKLFWQTKKVTFFICYSCNVYTMGWMIMYKWIVAKSELWPKISFTIHFYSTIK